MGAKTELRNWKMCAACAGQSGIWKYQDACHALKLLKSTAKQSACLIMKNITMFPAVTAQKPLAVLTESSQPFCSVYF